MARRMIDIELDEDEDLLTGLGDITLTESTAQHQTQLLLNNKGDFKQKPTICVWAFGFMDDEHFHNLIRAASIEFARDGMDVKNIALSPSGNISSDAYYR